MEIHILARIAQPYSLLLGPLANHPNAVKAAVNNMLACRCVVPVQDSRALHFVRALCHTGKCRSSVQRQVEALGLSQNESLAQLVIHDLAKWCLCVWGHVAA